jgi:hypothetical protein
MSRTDWRAEDQTKGLFTAYPPPCATVLWIWQRDISWSRSGPPRGGGMLPLCCPAADALLEQPRAKLGNIPPSTGIDVYGCINP